MQGRVVLISVARAGAASSVSVDKVRAVAGEGLEGDRYFHGAGTFSDKPGTGRQVTLIEAEAMDDVAAEHDAAPEYKDARRNIVTRGVRLNDLIDREFRVGGVRMRGMRLCDPCRVSFPDPNVKQALAGRGGLRADILSDGDISVGDPIET